LSLVLGWCEPKLLEYLLKQTKEPRNATELFIQMIHLSKASETRDEERDKHRPDGE
jgi:hypothetical protein